ncbi:MAG: SPFH domain-containing protein [Cytophagaceae bacterium]|nr:SPFH domain-containing protein [Cytophagaceae bacterium]MDW8457304.1 SPFH domain-containing protein [Cytophagaceae bacterium]
MGLFDKIKGEFIDVIEWIDNTNDTMIYRFERYNNEIKNGAKLTVRPGQYCVFISEGNEVGDGYGPGLHTLETQNMPIMTTLKSWKYGFNSPFKAEVYFFNLKEFTNLKWGLKNPIIVNDDRFGMIELRGFGTYAFKFEDPRKFAGKFLGTDGRFTTDEISEQLRSLIVMKFTDALAESKIPVEALAANVNELSKFALEVLNPEFQNDYGLVLTKFYVENLSMPDEVKKEIMELSRLNKIDLNKLAQLKMAKGLENSGGNNMGSNMMEMMMGMNIANQMMNRQGGNMNIGSNTPPPLVTYYVAVNGQQTGPYDINTLTQMAIKGEFKRESLVWTAGMAAWTAAGQVPELGVVFSNMPPPPPPPPPVG